MPRICETCEILNDKALKCKRCKAVYYCNRDCQQEDYHLHKNFCRKIEKAAKTVEEAKADLMQRSWFGTRHPCDWFSLEYVGNLWGMVEPRDYLRACYALASAYREMGEATVNHLAFEIALNMLLDIMRLAHSDNLGVRDEVPFLFICLGRYEDCYNFIKWWSTIDPKGQYDWGNAPKVEKGTWIYLRHQDMYEDMTTSPKTNKGRDISLSHLIALAMLKLILLANIADEVKKEEQMKIIEKLMEMIKQKNKYVMIGLATPSIYINNEPPEMYSPGDPQEACLMIQFSYHAMQTKCMALSREAMKQTGLKTENC